MGFHDHTCVSVLCDGCGNECWEDGLPHFDSRGEATDYLKRTGWLITTTRLLCVNCARDADCATTGHQHGQWEDREHLGIPYQVRRCEHCQDADYDPPWNELMVLRGAALVVDRAAENEETQ